MLEIGLTGARYSGKSTVGKVFNQIHIPVFDADTVLKFILNFRTYVEEPIKSNVGSFVYKGSQIDPNAFVCDSIFDRTIDVVEFELFQAWESFKKKNKNASYVIFKSSILFERNWHTRFKKVISVFAPKDERVLRCKYESGMRIDYIWELLGKEMSELDKNSKSHYIIHNYDEAPDIIEQINRVDEKIVNYYLDSIKSKKSQEKDLSDNIINSLFENNLRFLR